MNNIVHTNAISALLFCSMICSIGQLSPVMAQMPSQTGPDIPVEDPLAPDKIPAALSAKLTFDELAASAKMNEGSHMLKITVVNNGKRALLLDGDSVSLVAAALNQGSLALDDVIGPPSKNTLPGDVLEVAGSLSTIGILPVAVDAVNKSNNPGPAFYGKDEARRDVAEMRFGKRLIFPGESSSGELYLGQSVNTSASGQLNIPVYSHPEGALLGKLLVAVSMSPAPLASKPSRSVQRELPHSTELDRLPGELEKSLEKKQKAESRIH